MGSWTESRIRLVQLEPRHITTLRTPKQGTGLKLAIIALSSPCANRCRLLRPVRVWQFDLDKIEVRGEKIGAVRRKYQLHKDIERELLWMGPMTDLPQKVG
jgi:hypothetical protein